MDKIKKLLAATERAVAKGVEWATENKLEEKLKVTGMCVATAGMLYAIGSVASGMHMELETLKTSGMAAADSLRAAWDVGVKEIVGQQISSFGDISKGALAAVKAPFENNPVVEAWRGFGVAGVGLISAAGSSLAKVGMNAFPKSAVEHAPVEVQALIEHEQQSRSARPMRWEYELEGLLGDSADQEQFVDRMAEELSNEYGHNLDKYSLEASLNGDLAGRRFEGKVISVDHERGIVLQDSGRGNCVAHVISDLESVPNVGEVAKIAYDQSGRGVPTVAAQEKSHSFER